MDHHVLPKDRKFFGRFLDFEVSIDFWLIFMHFYAFIIGTDSFREGGSTLNTPPVNNILDFCKVKQKIDSDCKQKIISYLLTSWILCS